MAAHHLLHLGESHIEETRLLVEGAHGLHFTVGKPEVENPDVRYQSDARWQTLRVLIQLSL